MESQVQTNSAGVDTEAQDETSDGVKRRDSLRAAALANAMRKRERGVPSYTVPEAAALLSISQEYLYRLIQADGFPALVMRLGGVKGRYVVPAKAVERLLADATDRAASLDVGDWTEAWRTGAVGGAV